MANDSDSSSYGDLCATAKAIRVNGLVIFSGIGQTILAMITLILLLAVIFSYKKHKVSLHLNLKLLFLNIIFLYAFHNIFNVIIQGRYQILLYFSFDPCDLLTPAWLSIMLRVPGYIFVIAFVCFHFALTTERARATIFARRYEKEGVWYPLVCIVVILCLAIFVTGYVVVQALQDPKFSQQSVQVSLTSETNSTFLIYMNVVFLALVIATAIMDYLLLVANRKNRSRNSDYSLSRIYQIKENIDIMNFIWPLDVLYAVGYTIYLASATYVRIIKSKISYAQYIGYNDALYMVLIMHSIVTLLLYLRFIKKCRSKVGGIISEPNDPTRTYFEQLSAQWNIKV